MQSVSSRIWTRVAVSISHDDNDYTTGNYKFMMIFLNDCIQLVPAEYVLYIDPRPNRLSRDAPV